MIGLCEQDSNWRISFMGIEDPYSEQRYYFHGCDMSTDRKKGNYHHIILGAQVEKASHNNYVFQTKSTYQTYIRVKGYNEVKTAVQWGLRGEKVNS